MSPAVLIMALCGYDLVGYFEAVSRMTGQLGAMERKWLSRS